MKLLEKKTITKTKIFDVEEISFEFDGKVSQNMYRICCGDWANILAITSDKKAILVRQPRAGSMKFVLETPGGMIEKDERDATLTAVRELEEETGFTSQRILSLGSFNPNPPLMTNRVHFFLALNAYPNPNRSLFPDEGENIKVELIDLKSLNMLLRSGQIDHALSALCIMLAQKYVDIGDF